VHARGKDCGVGLRHPKSVVFIESGPGCVLVDAAAGNNGRVVACRGEDGEEAGKESRLWYAVTVQVHDITSAKSFLCSLEAEVSISAGLEVRTLVVDFENERGHIDGESLQLRYRIVLATVAHEHREIWLLGLGLVRRKQARQVVALVVDEYNQGALSITH
jgi:hypothetical protein